MKTVADESLLIGNSSGALVPATLGAGLDVDANNVISVDASALTDTILPTGTPDNNEVIIAEVSMGVTTYAWAPFPSSAQSNLSFPTPDATEVTIANSDGDDVTIPRATATAAGVMAAGDKVSLEANVTKLNGIEANATADQAISMTVTGANDAKVLNLVVDGTITTSINIHDLLQGVTLFN